MAIGATLLSIVRLEKLVVNADGVDDSLQTEISRILQASKQLQEAELLLMLQLSEPSDDL